MNIYNSLNKMNGLFNSKEDLNFTIWYGKNNCHNIKPKEGLYSLTHHFNNPRFLIEDQLEKKSQSKWLNKSIFFS